MIIGVMANPSQSSSDQEKQLLEQLRRHPELAQRIMSIMAMADDPDGEIRTADELEALLVEQVRQLGQTTMESWASQREEQSAKEFKERNPKSHCRKKND